MGFDFGALVAGHRITQYNPLTIRDISNTARDMERTVDNAGRLQGAVQGYTGTVDEARYTRTARGDAAHLGALRTNDQLLAYEANRGGYAPQQYSNGYGSQSYKPAYSSQQQNGGAIGPNPLVTQIAPRAPAGMTVIEAAPVAVGNRGNAAETQLFANAAAAALAGRGAVAPTF